MAHRFSLYTGIMAHWRRLYPGRIPDISYEALVADVSGTSRRLAAHVGMEWMDAMARPDLATGQELTLTAHQLRQPVHARSVAAWRSHRDMLAPFIQALDPALWPDLV